MLNYNNQSISSFPWLCLVLAWNVSKKTKKQGGKLCVVLRVGGVKPEKEMKNGWCWRGPFKFNKINITTTNIIVGEEWKLLNPSKCNGLMVV